MLSKLKKCGTEKIGLVHSVVLLTKPRREYCEDQIGTILDIRAVQRRSHGATTNPTLFSLKEIPLNWTEHMLHTGSLWAMVHRQGGFKSEQETSLFLPTLESAKSVIERADDRLDRTSSRTKHGTAEAKQSPRS